MLLTEARSILNAATKRDNSYTDTEDDNAIKYALSELIRRTRCTRTSGTVSLTANVAEASTTSLTDFRDERLIHGELLYPDQGTWETATAYAVNDTVQGDGDPDALFYKCVAAHTSSSSDEPPDSAYWTRVAWPEKYDLDHVNYRYVADQLNACATTGQPEYLSFRLPTVAVVYPAPDAAYDVRLTYWQPLVSWTSGTATPNDVTLNIPDEYVRGAILLGASAALLYADPAELSTSEHWRRFEDFIGLVRSAVGMTGYNKAPSGEERYFL